MATSTCALTLAVFLGSVAMAGAEQSVQLEFKDGRVWLRASEAPIREILREWARLGDATIVNGDKVTGPPVTLELDGVPERQALDVILRDVPGYVLGARATGSDGSSTFDRILIVPTTTRPLPPAQAAAARRPSNVEPADNGLPEQVAALLESGLMTSADRRPTDVDGLDRDEQLPEGLADIIRAVTDAATAETASRPSRTP